MASTSQHSNGNLSMELVPPSYNNAEYARLSHLPQRPPVNISFQDLTYTVPFGRKNSKIILRGVSGEFKTGQLTAILGPSGAGKSTLLNILAGYRCVGATGTIATNGEPRKLRQFRKLSRYIMQEDLLQPLITVHEALYIAADLKLGKDLTKEKKLVVVEEILQLLRLSKARDTRTERLSGGERKRVSIALELVNNPPVVFLDEPTTGLDDLSSGTCLSLLKRVARGGRTVVCSLHTPSARLFAQLDHVYVVAAGSCAYSGSSSGLVPFLDSLKLPCPTHYNPADFAIEIASGEYGDHLDSMVKASENGRSNKWSNLASSLATNSAFLPPEIEQLNTEVFTRHQYKYRSSGGEQFIVLFSRMMLQMRRNSAYLWMRLVLHIFLGIIIGLLFFQMGNDGSKTIFNFGFCYSCLIAVLYIPMLPTLLAFPTEVQLLKREYFNRWYGLKPYYAALMLSRAPPTILFTTIFLLITYFLTAQPLELLRMSMFFLICIFVALIAETIGIVISSSLNVVNSVFTGPALCVPLMLLAVYGIGLGSTPPPLFWDIARRLSFLRYGLEGLIFAVYGYDRPDLDCPVDFTIRICEYKNTRYFMHMMGMGDVTFLYDFSMLVFMFVMLNGAGYYLLRQRLSPNNTFQAIKYIGRFVKTQISAQPH